MAKSLSVVSLVSTPRLEIEIRLSHTDRRTAPKVWVVLKVLPGVTWRDRLWYWVSKVLRFTMLEISVKPSTIQLLKTATIYYGILVRKRKNSNGVES